MTLTACLLCRHCNRPQKHLRRRLCSRCYYRLDIRALYPPDPRFTYENWDFHRRAPLPAEPTPALPGTAAKIRVLTERARQRVQLFHPLDARS